MPVRPLSMSDLGSLVEAGELKKGQVILDQGKLRHLARTESKLYAEAAGSRGSSYQTSITFNDAGAVLGKRGRRGNCTCRAAWSRDFCKHAAALLLAWSKTPDAFALHETPMEREAQSQPKDQPKVRAKSADSGDAAADTAESKTSTGTGPTRRRRKVTSKKATSKKVDGTALKKEGAERVDTLVRELATTGVSSVTKERISQLNELAANLFQLQLRRLEERTLGLSRLLAKGDPNKDAVRTASMLADLLLTAARIKAHCDGKPLENRYINELIGKSWLKKDRAPVEDLQLLEYAFSTFTNNKDTRICMSRMLDLGSGEHYIEMQITPKQIVKRTPPKDSYAGKILEGVKGGLFPGFAPRRLKLESDEHRRRVSQADLTKVAEHATSIADAIATFHAQRRDIFAPARTPVLVRVAGLVSHGDRLRVFDDDDHTLHLHPVPGLERRIGNLLEGCVMQAIFGELDLEHAVPTLRPSSFLVHSHAGLALRSSGRPPKRAPKPTPRPWTDIAAEAGLSYAAVSLGEVREELAQLMVGGLTGLDPRAAGPLVSRLQTLKLAKPAAVLEALAEQSDPAQRVSGFVKLYQALGLALVRLCRAAPLRRDGLVSVPTHQSIFIPRPDTQLSPSETMTARLKGTITRYEAAVHYHRHYQSLTPEQIAHDHLVLADGAAAPHVIEVLSQDPSHAIEVAESILAMPMGTIALRTAFTLLTRAATPEAELNLKQYSGRNRKSGRRFGQRLVHMADDALIELELSQKRPRLSLHADSRRDHLEYKLPPLLHQARADKDAGRRALACEALAEMGATGAIEELRALFRDDPAAEVREQAAMSLAMLGDAQIVEELLIAVRRSGPKHKSMAHVACRALGHLGDSRAMPTMTELYHQGFTPSVMADAWLRFGVLALEPILSMLDAEPGLAKRSALAAPLESIPTKILVDRLIARLRGSNDRVDLDDDAVATRVVAYLKICQEHKTARAELARRLQELHCGGKTDAGTKALNAIKRADGARPRRDAVRRR